MATLWPLAFLWAQAPSFSALAGKAATAREADRLTDAADLYQKALALNSGWKEGWWFLGTVEYDLNLYESAAAAFEKLAALDSKAGSARIMLGLCEFELGRDAKALIHIQEGERVGVADNQQLRNVALFHEGVLLQRDGKFEAAERALDSLCIAGVESPSLTATLGMTAFRLRAHEPPSQSPEADVLSRAGHAQCLAAKKQFDDARREYASLVRDYPKFPRVHYAFGHFLLDANDLDAGVKELEVEIKLQPEDSIARLQIAAAKYKIDSAGALPYARAAVEHDPELALGHYLLGLLLLDTGDFRSAIPELETARRSLPLMPNVYAALGTAYAQAGRDEDAAKARAILQRLHREAASPGAPQP